jgi:hypothetical protein
VAKCKHLNMQLTEFTLVSTDHEFKDGQLLEPNFNQHEGDMTNNNQVDCFQPLKGD